jgi:hypothetical protein
MSPDSLIALRGRFKAMTEVVSPLPAKAPAPAELFVYERPARRLELLVRIVYWILIGIVLWVYGLLAGICGFLQWFVILFLGRRNLGLSDFIRGYLEYYVHVTPYLWFMTDRRPGIMPVKVRIYEEGPLAEGTT